MKVEDEQSRMTRARCWPFGIGEEEGLAPSYKLRCSIEEVQTRSNLKQISAPLEVYLTESCQILYVRELYVLPHV